MVRSPTSSLSWLGTFSRYPSSRVYLRLVIRTISCPNSDGLHPPQTMEIPRRRQIKADARPHLVGSHVPLRKISIPLLQSPVLVAGEASRRVYLLVDSRPPFYPLFGYARCETCQCGSFTLQDYRPVYGDTLVSPVDRDGPEVVHLLIFWSCRLFSSLALWICRDRLP